MSRMILSIVLCVLMLLTGCARSPASGTASEYATTETPFPATASVPPPTPSSTPNAVLTPTPVPEHVTGTSITTFNLMSGKIYYTVLDNATQKGYVYRMEPDGSAKELLYENEREIKSFFLKSADEALIEYVIETSAGDPETVNGLLNLTDKTLRSITELEPFKAPPLLEYLEGKTIRNVAMAGDMIFFETVNQAKSDMMPKIYGTVFNLYRVDGNGDFNIVVENIDSYEIFNDELYYIKHLKTYKLDAVSLKSAEVIGDYKDTSLNDLYDVTRSSYGIVRITNRINQQWTILKGFYKNIKVVYDEPGADAFFMIINRNIAGERPGILRVRFDGEILWSRYDIEINDMKVIDGRIYFTQTVRSENGEVETGMRLYRVEKDWNDLRAL